MRRILLDTNAVVSLLAGDTRIEKMVQESEWVGISVITKLEFLSFPELAAEDESLFDEFEHRVNVVELTHHDQQLIKETVRLRRSKAMKLPDALILASGIVNNACVVTADAGIIRHGGEHAFRLTESPEEQ